MIIFNFCIISFEAGKEYSFGELKVIDQKNLFDKNIVDSLTK